MASTVPFDKIIDSELRVQIIGHLAEMIGLNDDDLMVLWYLIMGDVKDIASPQEILKKIKLPRVRGKYNEKRMKELATMMADRMKELDQYGIIDLDANEIRKNSKNGQYITILGVEMMPLVYVNIWRMLSVKQQYMVDTLLGIKEAIDIIIKFLQIEKE